MEAEERSPDGAILVVAATSQELARFRQAQPADVRCLVSGMGEKAGAAVREELQRQRYRLVVSTGFSGGLRPGFQVGDLVMASEVIEESSGLRRRPGMTFGLNGMASVGPFLTVRRILSDPALKQQGGVRFGAIAVDLETSAVAEAAIQAGVGWVAIRSILDPMEVRLAVDSWRQGLRMLAVPTRWGQMRLFVRAVHGAGQSLAEGLRRFLKTQVPGT